MADEIDIAKAQKKRAKARKEWFTFASRVVAQIVGAAASVGLGLYLVQRGQQANEPSAAAVSPPPAPTRVETARKAGEVALAVLPLSNFSADPHQEYFADGMTEALTAELVQIKGLRVISRTSVMQYKNTRKSIPQVAQELAVDFIVEGSVNRDADRVRVTAQLIDSKGV